MDNFENKLEKEILFTLDRIRAYERNKAIDDYMNKLCNHCLRQKNECYKLECPFCTDGCDIVNIAEQLKAGVSSGTNNQ